MPANSTMLMTSLAKKPLDPGLPLAKVLMAMVRKRLRRASVVTPFAGMHAALVHYLSDIRILFMIGS